jgi:hypothetical protein
MAMVICRRQRLGFRGRHLASAAEATIDALPRRLFARRAVGVEHVAADSFHELRGLILSHHSSSRPTASTVA